MANRAPFEEHEQWMKAEIARMMRVDLDDLDDLGITRITDHVNTCEVFTANDGRRARVAHETIRARTPQPPDPFVEAFTEVALALHEAEKRRSREVPT